MPCARAILPIAAAGLTSPPLVGTQVFHPFVDHPLECVDVELAAGIARHHVDDRAGSLGDLKEGDIICGVFRLGGQDSVALAERQRIERHLPGNRRVLHQRDLVGRGIEQARHRAVDRVEPVGFAIGGRIAADLAFQIDVPLHRRNNRRRHQGSACVVQICEPGGSWRVGPYSVEVDHLRPPKLRCRG
jgi:hypothetical protein